MSWKRIGSGLANLSSSSKVKISSSLEDKNTVTSINSTNKSITESSVSQTSKTVEGERDHTPGSETLVGESNTRNLVEWTSESLPILSNSIPCSNQAKYPLPPAAPKKEEEKEDQSRSRAVDDFDSLSSVSSGSILDVQDQTSTIAYEEESATGYSELLSSAEKDPFQEQKHPEPQSTPNNNFLQFISSLITDNRQPNFTAIPLPARNMGNKYDIQRCCHPMFVRRNSASSSSSTSSQNESNSPRRVIFPTLYHSSTQVEDELGPSKKQSNSDGNVKDNSEVVERPKNTKKDSETPIPSIISLSNSLPQSQLVHENELKQSLSNDESLITLSTSSISYGKINHSYDDGCLNDQILSDEDEIELERVCEKLASASISPLSQSEKERTNRTDLGTSSRVAKGPSILRKNSNDKKHVRNERSQSPKSSSTFPTSNTEDKLNLTFHDYNTKLNEDEALIYTQHLHASHGKTIRKSLSDSCLNGFKIKKVFAANNHVESSDSMSATSSLHTSRIQNKISPNNSERRRQVLYTRQITRHISHEAMGRTKIIRFDPRIWVHEIHCPPVDKIWYSEAELNQFKCEAVLRIQKWSTRMRQRRVSTSMIPTGTGRILSHGDTSVLYTRRNSERITYTNPALSCEAEDEDDEVQSWARIISIRQAALMNEFRSVLIVDNHDLFLNLLSKGIKLMLPHVSVTTATTVDQALREIEKANGCCNHKSRGESYSHGFDLIIIEERLVPHVQPQQRGWNRRRLQNGSILIERIKKDLDNTPTHKKVNKRLPLIVGVSAYLDHDKQRLLGSGADVVWCKPPPKMDDDMRIALLQKVMEKRNRPNANELFQ